MIRDMELKHHKRVQQCRTPKDLLLVVVKEETCCKKSWETQPSENASRSKRTETMKPFPTKKEMGKGKEKQPLAPTLRENVVDDSTSSVCFGR